MGILNLESLKDTQIRMMPDIHAGKGCTVGTTITLKDKVIPNLTGVDIGCGMFLIKINEKSVDLEKLDKVITEQVPSGFSIHDEPLPEAETFDFSGFRCPVNIENAKKSLGSLGGGNHFCELNKDDEGNLYLVVHSGSRHLGLEVCNYYQDLAYHDCNGSSKDEIDSLIKNLKKESIICQ